MKASTAFASVLVPLALVCVAAPAVSAQDLGADRDALRRLVVRADNEPDLQMVRRADGRISLVATEPYAAIRPGRQAAPAASTPAPVRTAAAAAAPSVAAPAPATMRAELVLRAPPVRPAPVRVVRRF